MPGLIGRDPKEAFDTFRDHIAGILNKTITDSRLSLVHRHNSAEIAFRHENVAFAAPLFARDLFLSIGQKLRVDLQSGGTWRLKTLQYTYRIQGADEKNCLRWEYVSRDVRDKLFCRHHFQAPIRYQLAGKNLSLEEVHLPTGWVTIEEIIRFLIVELGVAAKAAGWDGILRQSEQQFRNWTERSI